MILTAHTSRSELISYCKLAQEYQVRRVSVSGSVFVRIAALCMYRGKNGSFVFMGIKFVQK